MEFDQVGITITNGDCEIFATHQITDKYTAQILLNQLDPFRYEAPAIYPDGGALEFNVIDDLKTALEQFTST